MSDPFVSVIVPVLDDAVQLDGLLLSLHLDRDVQDVEIIVANGAAVDSTIQGLRSQFPDVLWTDGTPGRGRQMKPGQRARERAVAAVSPCRRSPEPRLG